ncbi:MULTISPECIES: helix-turn-helix domain-containing protein [unclassified Streptomyces]|uniref:helix-turn-helix domain-containing protein n=1 Tax=unclassified Streptomyces TaxID=2593676 RepID=UPI002270080D|nr:MULTISPECIES: helix-turn-helix domain-containing protein [unclassified Streptomyces]MCY0921876.1 helix-turn-helix domain-containing protein [Streptomyces sp. H27-G5]MCY0957175.1 helix-turn-helix domain-containing protein [Streptomyces sp. H27-H5]
MTDLNAIPLFRLVDRDLLAKLMKRTGTGAAMSVRELAAEAGVTRSTVGNLLSGGQVSVFYPTACQIADAIGVDVLILFTPTGRATRHPGRSRLEATV